MGADTKNELFQGPGVSTGSAGSWRIAGERTFRESNATLCVERRMGSPPGSGTTSDRRPDLALCGSAPSATTAWRRFHARSRVGESDEWARGVSRHEHRTTLRVVPPPRHDPARARVPVVARWSGKA